MHVSRMEKDDLMQQMMQEGSPSGEYLHETRKLQMSLLPHCSSSLRKHIQRSSYVASLWRQASHPLTSVGNMSDHGWRTDLTPDWTDEPYLEDIAELLIESDDMQESADEKEDTDIEYVSDIADEGDCYRHFYMQAYNFTCIVHML